MERRSKNKNLSRESSGGNGSMTLQKRLVESRKPAKLEHIIPPAPDLTDFMNDMFFGTANVEEKKVVYNLTGDDRDLSRGGFTTEDDKESDFDDSTRSNSSRLTQEWLEEARRMVPLSPSRSNSPSRLVGSPRYAAPAAVPARLSVSSVDRRDPLSRSARRHRPVDGYSEEILSKSAKHTRNRSETTVNLPESPTDTSPASAVQKWFATILKPSTNPTSEPHHQSTDPPFPTTNDPLPLTLPPRLSTYRRSRFQTDSPTSQPQDVPVISRRTFKTQKLPPLTDSQLLSPPKNLVESEHRRSISSSTCAFLDGCMLSPPRNLVESTHRRSISKSTCSVEKTGPKISNVNGWRKEEDGGREISLNGFLKEQKITFNKILNGEIESKAKIVLSGPSNSTSSMVAAMCYAWLLENRERKSKRQGDGIGYTVVPVMNVSRGKMWKQQQAAWLFNNAGLDATSLLFVDEVDLETLMMSGKLSILVIGQDVLKTNGEAGSLCTILTDNYCEDAYELLQTHLLKKLLLAGILLDTQNLNVSDKSSMTRDAEAAQLLLVGSTPNYRNTLFDQLMQEERDDSFLEALQRIYGKHPSEMILAGRDGRAQLKHVAPERRSTSIHHDNSVQNSNKKSDVTKPVKTKSVSPQSAKLSQLPTQAPKASPQPAPNASRGKNKFFLAKWLGF